MARYSEKNIRHILDRIVFLRNKLNNLIEEKNNLLDSEVLEVSISLDKTLNEYNKLNK